jgi:hypothetical protein
MTAFFSGVPQQENNAQKPELKTMNNDSRGIFGYRNGIFQPDDCKIVPFLTHGKNQPFFRLEPRSYAPYRSSFFVIGRYSIRNARLKAPECLGPTDSFFRLYWYYFHFLSIFTMFINLVYQQSKYRIIFYISQDIIEIFSMLWKE